MAMPCSFAAAITSSSRIEPPGWITAVIPASAAWSKPSRNGKNASDANTEPGPAHVVTNQSMLTIDDSVTLTIDDNKILIPDVYNINR